MSQAAADFWKSAKEWAEIALPGIPATMRGFNKLAERTSLIRRCRQGHGGGYEYPLSALPIEAQRAYLDRLFAKAAEKSGTELAVIPEKLPTIGTGQLKTWQRRTMDARLIVLMYVDELAFAIGLTAAVRKVVQEAKQGRLPDSIKNYAVTANARGKTGKRTLSRSTIFNWLKARESGVAALAPELPPKTGRIPIWAADFLHEYRRPQKPSIHEVVRILERRGVQISYDQARRFVKCQMSRLEIEKGRLGPNELNAKIKMYKRRDTSGMKPLEVCLVDGHSFKARVANPMSGRAFHPEVCGVIDARTRVCVGWSAWLAESAYTVSAAVLHAMTVNENKPYGGIPLVLYSDLGAGNTSKQNTEEVIGFFSRAGINHHTGIPGNAKARGLIERAQKSLWIRPASKLPTYTGKNMSREVARQVYLRTEKDLKNKGESELLIPWKEFLNFLAQEVDCYNRTPHRSLPKIKDPIHGKMRHMSPFECWKSFLDEGWTPTLPLAEELADWGRPQKKAIVQRGLVSLATNVYGHRELEHHHGKEVVVEFDVHDPAHVWVRDLDGKLICKAIFDYNKTDFFPKAMIQKYGEERAKRRIKNIERKREEIELELAGPKREAIDISPEQQESLERIQLEFQEAEKIKEADRREAAEKLAAFAEASKEPVKKAKLWDTPQEKYEDLCDRLRSGEALSPEEVGFLDAHEKKYGFKAAVNEKRSSCNSTALGTP